MARQLDGVTFNTALIAAGTEAELSRTGGKVTGKTNIVPQRALVRGDLRTVSAEQLADAQARMQAVVQQNLPRTSAVLTFSEGYPAMPPSPANYALLAQLDAASRDLGLARSRRSTRAPAAQAISPSCRRRCRRSTAWVRMARPAHAERVERPQARAGTGEARGGAHLSAHALTRVRLVIRH